MLEIVHVLSGSTGARLGLQAGDFVISVNGQEVEDVIDFQFFSAEEDIVLRVRHADGSTRKLKVHKDPDDGLGLEFAPLKIKRCRNNCIFCFVDQMPPGSRKSLYIKDDDYRASFLYGNFITLGALSEADWERIFKQRLSPLYVSVHTTDPALRSLLLNNKKAPPIIDSLKRLAAGGIRIHAQIVLCPGVNDGTHLEKTIADLSRLYPAVLSVAVVPVGVTAFRKGLSKLVTFSRKQSQQVIRDVESFGRTFKRRFGTRLVFPSDEFYIKAGYPVPSPSFYEEFPQLENGVGMVSTFLRNVARTRLPSRVEKMTATLITGSSFSTVLKNVVGRLRSIEGLFIKQVTVKNSFFGSSVTVAGLLSGGDILRALKGKRVGNMLIIPSNMLKENEAVFIDGMTLEQLQKQLKVKVFAVERFSDLVRLLRKKGAKA